MDDPLEVPVKKLGHPVLEIRTWAFFSLLSKLECDLISLQDLTENEDIIGKLVQWIKHDKCSQQDKILELLHSLVQHSSKNIERLLSFDPELLSLKRLQKVEQHQEIITDILNTISQSGIRKDVTAASVLELHWNETNRPDFEDLFSTYRLPLDSIADQDIHVLTQWELAFDSEDTMSQQKATMDFTCHLIQDFHVQSFLQHSSFMKIVLKKLNNVNSINSVKHVIQCLDSCLTDIEEQKRLELLLKSSNNSNQIYCRLTVPFFYLSLLDSLLPHIKIATKLCLRIVSLLASCVRSVEALWSSSSLIGSHFCSSVISTLRALCEKSNECRDPFLKVQLFLLISSTIQSLLPGRGLASHLPAPIQGWMCAQVTRPDLYYLYNSLVRPWYELCAREFPENKELGVFKSVLHIKACLTSALDSNHHADSMPVSQTIQCLFDSLPSLYFHRDVSIVCVFMRVCSHNVIEDPDDLIHAQNILLSLLSCSDVSIQLATYSSLDQCVQRILRNEPLYFASGRHSSNTTPVDSASCGTNEDSSSENPLDGRLRNSRNMIDGDHNFHASPIDSASSRTNDASSMKNPPGSAGYDPVKRLGFMLDTEVLIELICQGSRSGNEEIRLHSHSILQSLLSARVSVSIATWNGLLQALSPVLCLLQCLVPSEGVSSELGAEIIQLTHPDLAKDIRVTKLQIIKCNACLLYHKDSAVRLEATARLAWSTQYAGAVTSTLADLCVTGCTRSSLLVDVYEESSVTRVLELLTLSSRGSSAPDEESRVRFSCLTQLSVMMDDVKLHRVFIESGGVAFVVQELHGLLSNHNTKLPDYTKRKQSIGCCVRVLRNACENNSSVRQYLSSEHALLVDVVKVLFLYESCRSDTVQLLFILLYADFALNSAQDGSVVSVAALVRENLHVPDPYCGTHWDNSPHTLPDDTDLLLSDAQCKQHLSIHWNLQHLYGGNIHKMLRDESPHASQMNTQAKQPTNIPPSALTISKDLWKLLRRASIVQTCSTSLQVLQSTSSYSEAYTAVSTLQRYLDLKHIEGAAELDKLPFSSVLHRYLEPAPSSIQDQQLLLLVLNVVQTLPDTQLEWVSDLLISKQTLLSLIKPTPTPLSHHSLLCIQLLNTVRRIILTHPDCVHAYGSLTKSVLRCIEQHSMLDSPLAADCLNYLSHVFCLTQNTKDSPLAAACLNYLSHVFCLTQNTKGLDTECLWHLLASVPLSDTRVRSDLACKVLVCLDLVWGSKLNDSVASGVWLSEINWPALRSCLSPIQGSVKTSYLQGSVKTSYPLQDSVKTSYPLQDSVKTSYPLQGSVKAAAYHLVAGLCYTRGSVASVVHNIPGLVDGALAAVLTACDLEARMAALVVANITSFSTCEILLQKCIDEDFFLQVIPILSNPRSSDLKSAVCSLVNNLFNLNPQLLAQTDAMVQMISLLINELIKSCSGVLDDDVTEYCTAIARILTQYYILSPEVPPLSDKFHASLIYILNASSYERHVSLPLRDTLWTTTLSLLSSLPLPPPLPATVTSTLCYCLKTDSPKTARSILAILPNLVPHLQSDNLEPLCHVVFSAWSRRFKPCPVLLNCLLALTAAHRPQGPPGPLLVLEYDLLDDIHTRLKQFYVSLECSHGDSLLCTEMDIYLKVLNNILAQDTRVCEVATKCGLADTIHKLLGWVLASESTLTCLLLVLTTFTAHCIPASTSCAHTSTLLGSGLSRSSSSSSLVHCLLSLAVTTPPPHNSELRVRTLAILSNLVASNECRLVISKSSLFDHFTDTTLNRKLPPPLETAWLRFLKSYSLHLSHYNNPVDSVHFIDTLIDRTYRNLHYLIPLTNLTFHSSYQTKLGANAKFLKLVHDILSESDSISVNRCAKVIRGKLSEEIDGGKEAVRSINEKLFGKYFELLLFDSSVNRQRTSKTLGHCSTNSCEDRCTKENTKCSRENICYQESNRSSLESKRHSQSSKYETGDARSSECERRSTRDGKFDFSPNFLDDVLDETYKSKTMDEQLRNPYISTSNEKENIKNNRQSNRRSHEFNRNNGNTKCQSSKRESHELHENKRNEIHGEDKSHSYESYRESIGHNDIKRTSTLEKYAKLLQTKSDVLKSNVHISETVLGAMEAETHAEAFTNVVRTSHRNAITNLNVLSNKIARILDMSQAFDTVLTDELNRVIKRNAALIVWNLSANNFKMKLNFKHVGLVSCLQNALKRDVDFQEEYVYVLDMLLSKRLSGGEASA